jgi:hypothetical protein
MVLLPAVGVVSARAQKLPTAEKKLDLQGGGDFLYGHSDYGTRLKGFGGYAAADFTRHFGAEFDFHQANGVNQIYERTYELGGRYVLHFNRLNPYAKVMIGRGVFNFPPYPGFTESRANLAYNMLAFGGGADYRLKRYLNLRADFEYQDWRHGTLLPNGLTPYMVTVGAAYRFH